MVSLGVCLYFIFKKFIGPLGPLCFFKFISKCQKEIMRCAPLSSHMCDFFNMSETLFAFSVNRP